MLYSSVVLPDDISQKDFISYLAKTGKCESASTEFTCSIRITSGVDFLRTIKYCNLLGDWSIAFSPKNSRLNFVIKYNNGYCVVSTTEVNGSDKKCLLSEDNINQMTSEKNFSTIRDYEENLTKQPSEQKSIRAYFDAVKPLVDCIGEGETVIKTSEPIIKYFNRES